MNAFNTGVISWLTEQLGSLAAALDASYSPAASLNAGRGRCVGLIQGGLRYNVVCQP